MTDQRDALTWTDTGVPVSTRFDDPYFSLADGQAETEHVFLAGNDLPARFMPGFHIAELGFGTGLNFLTALRSFRAAGVGGVMRFTSFEAYPLAREDQRRALARYPELPIEALDGAEDADLRVIVGDARETVPAWECKADAWFLDGFSPAKNPDMWAADLLDAVARKTISGGTAATYTAAGFVRRSLEEGGFSVNRVAGFGRKRHMTRAVLAR